jgi:putative NIF3 family GTP cyclohydrolase 1 type 2
MPQLMNEIFRGLKSMTLADPLQASLLRLSAKGISVFSPHTSLDATPNGINTFLIQPFVQYAKDGTSEVITPPGEKVAGFEGAGMGRRVDLGKGLEVSEVVRIVKEHLSLEHGRSIGKSWEHRAYKPSSDRYTTRPATHRVDSSLCRIRFVRTSHYGIRLTI